MKTMGNSERLAYIHTYTHINTHMPLAATPTTSGGAGEAEREGIAPEELDLEHLLRSRDVLFARLSLSLRLHLGHAILRLPWGHLGVLSLMRAAV